MEAPWKTVQCILEASHYQPLPFTMNDPLPPSHPPTDVCLEQIVRHDNDVSAYKLWSRFILWNRIYISLERSLRSTFLHIPRVPHPPSKCLSWLWYTCFTSLQLCHSDNKAVQYKHTIVKTQQYNIITFIITELEIIITGCHIPQPPVSHVNMWAIHWRSSWTLKNTLKCS